MKKEHLANFNIAGFTYYDGIDCFEQLQIGTNLKLVLETDNKYDPRAVAIYFNEFKLGFVPRADNRIIYKLLSVGLDCISTKIQMIDASEDPEGQIRVVMHLVNGNENK